MRHSQHTHGNVTEHSLTLTGPEWLPMALALVLGLAAVVSGLTAWRVAVHSGHAETGFAMSTQAVARAGASSQEVNRTVASEQSLFISWDQAVESHDQSLVDSIWGMMDSGTQAAIRWWQGQSGANRPPDPFSSANPEWTTPRQVIEATAAVDDATEQLAEAQAQLNRAHDLELLGALLAIALLTGGLTATMRTSRSQVTLFGVSCAALTIATVGLVVQW